MIFKRYINPFQTLEGGCQFDFYSFLSFKYWGNNFRAWCDNMEGNEITKL